MAGYTKEAPSLGLRGYMRDFNNSIPEIPALEHQFLCLQQNEKA